MQRQAQVILRFLRQRARGLVGQSITLPATEIMDAHVPPEGGGKIWRDLNGILNYLCDDRFITSPLMGEREKFSLNASMDFTYSLTQRGAAAKTPDSDIRPTHSWRQVTEEERTKR